MKRRGGLWLFLLLAALLLTGCAGNTAPEAPSAPEAPAQGPGEELSFDDSQSFTYVDPGYSYAEELARTYMEELYPQKIAEAFDGYSLVGSDVYSARDGRLVYGWLAFDGSPKGADWPRTELDGRQVYCRSFSLSSSGDGEWSARRSIAMEPLKLWTKREELYPKGAEAGMGVPPTDILLREDRVEGLVSARLTVSDLGKDYTLTDPAALAELEQALSGSATDAVYAFPDSCGHFDPLLLSFADGSRRLIYAAGDGSNVNKLWADGLCVSSLGKSLWELFGVEAQPAGWSVGEDGCARSLLESQGMYVSEIGAFTGKATEWETQELLYDAQGRLAVSDFQQKPTDEFRRDLLDGEQLPEVMHDRYEFSYDGEGRLSQILSYWTTARGYELHETTAYRYDEAGRLLEKTVDHGQDIWHYQVVTRYEYDGQGRLTAEVRANSDGSGETLKEYWYDEAGLRHERVDDGLGTDTPARRENG